MAALHSLQMVGGDGNEQATNWDHHRRELPGFVWTLAVRTEGNAQISGKRFVSETDALSFPPPRIVLRGRHRSRLPGCRRGRRIPARVIVGYPGSLNRRHLYLRPYWHEDIKVDDRNRIGVLDSGRPPSHAFCKRAVWAIPCLLFLALLPFYHLAWSAQGTGLSHDDGIYLVTAKALATGKGYTIISLPGELPQTKYPILFPLLLSFLWRMDPGFPENVGLLKLLPLAATVIWMAGVYRLARTLAASRMVSCCVTACVAATPWVVSFSGALRSESVFAALATWTVILLLRAERTGDWRAALWAAMLAAAAYHTRTAAVSSWPEYSWASFSRAGSVQPSSLAAVSGALCLPWILWQAQQNILSPVERYYTSLSYREENVILRYFTGPEKLVIIHRNLLNI